MITWALTVATLAFSGAEARKEASLIESSLRQQFQSFLLLARDCGAVADGVTDDTRALQGCVDSLPEWATLDGEGRSYLVSRIQLKSRMRVRNFRFVKFAGRENMTSPLSLDGRRVPQSDVLVEDVVVNGMRQFETEMVTPSAEDGGRHCFRFVGQLRRVVLANVEGNYCGSDGLQLGGHHATYSDVPQELPVQDVVVRDSRFRWNRRVGIAFEGTYRLFLVNVVAESNGLSLPGEHQVSSGSYCAHVDGSCFGSGIWTENDHDAAGGSHDSVYLIGVRAVQNYTRAFYAFSQSGPRVKGFRAKTNLNLVDSVFDAGVHPIPGNPIAIQFNSVSPDGAGAVWSGVRIIGCQVSGTITGRSIEKLTVEGSAVTGPLLGFLEYFDDISVKSVQRNGDFASSHWLRPDGSSGAVVRY